MHLKSCMVKCCKLLVQNYYWWCKITCSKHVEDNLSEINYSEKCASCWSSSRMCITMHGSQNVKNVKRYLLFWGRDHFDEPRTDWWIIPKYSLREQGGRLRNVWFAWFLSIQPRKKNGIISKLGLDTLVTNHSIIITHHSPYHSVRCRNTPTNSTNNQI